MPVYFYSDREDTMIQTCPGRPYPLGAFYDGHGINFAIYSEYATKVYLCLFRPSHDGKQQLIEYARINIKGKFLFLCLA
jgi:pullulanase/glycogen debranching enzyme